MFLGQGGNELSKFYHIMKAALESQHSSIEVAYFDIADQMYMQHYLTKCYKYVIVARKHGHEHDHGHKHNQLNSYPIPYVVLTLNRDQYEKTKGQNTPYSIFKDKITIDTLGRYRMVLFPATNKVSIPTCSVTNHFDGERRTIRVQS